MDADANRMRLLLETSSNAIDTERRLMGFLVEAAVPRL